MTVPSDATIRIPTAFDAEAIAQVHFDCFCETYSAMLPPKFFDDRARQDKVQLWNRALGQDIPGREIRVAEQHGRMVGFAAALPSGEPTLVSNVELAVIYVLACAHGSGIGQQLLDAALGDRAAALWMAEGNARALAFYRRNHFEPTGERRQDQAFDGLPEIRLARDCSDSSGMEQSAG